MVGITLVSRETGEVLQVGPVRIRVLEDGSRTDNRIGAVEVTVPARTAPTPPHVHRMHDETFLVTSGVVHFTVGDANQAARAGDYVVVPVGAPHSFANATDETAVFFNSFTPAYYVNYFRDLAKLSAAGGLSRDRILQVMTRYATEPAEPAGP